MNILTFDLEDWFHLLEHEQTKGPAQWARFPSRLESNTDRILHILDDQKVQATFFILGWVAEKYPGVIRKIVGADHELGCHSYSHQLVHHQTPTQFSEDLKKSLDQIEQATGQKVTAYRAPGFSITENSVWAIEILSRQGILFDSSLFVSARAHGGFLSFPLKSPGIIKLISGQLKEFPIVPAKFLAQEIIYSGGGYFRLLPQSVIMNLFKKSQYNMTYFHPRDFDPDQPVVPKLSLLRKFKSYYGLKGAEGKLRTLLNQFPFLSIQQADQQIDWTSAPCTFLNPTGLFEIQKPSLANPLISNQTTWPKM